MFRITIFIIALVSACPSVIAQSVTSKHKAQSISVPHSDTDKIFIREYSYNASDDDSKNSARKKATTELQRILSEEVGTHIQHSLQIRESVKDGVNQMFVVQEINSLSAAISKLEILDENWDGSTYYMKASVSINEDRAMSALLEAIKAKSSEKDVLRLNKILEEQSKNLDLSNETIRSLRKKILAQEIQNQASIEEIASKKDQVANLNKEIESLQQEIEKYNQEIKKQKSDIVKAKSVVAKARKRIAAEKDKFCLIGKGMTKREVEAAIGEPASWNSKGKLGLFDDLSWEWYYGSVIVLFSVKTQTVVTIEGC